MADAFVITTRSETETEALGGRLSKALFTGAFIALYGDLGAGKTAFARGVGYGLHIKGIKSPTFTIVQTHCGTLTLHHFDVYRLRSKEELDEIGFDEYLDEQSVILMEWPGNVEGALPKARLDVHIAHEGDDARSFRFIPHDKRHALLLRVLEDAPC